MPHLEPADVSHLRPWLIRTLEPICDADPQVLADYVLALLKHDASEAELRNMFAKQLADFLEHEAPAFIEQLLAALRTKSYMPYAADAPAARSEDPGIPIPLDALVPPAAGQKRSAEGDDFERAPPKGPRLSSDGNFSRYGPGPSHSNGGAWRGGEQRGQGAGRGGYANGGANGRQQNDMSQRGRRGLCRDYHNLGYCARGALCPYSHGNDAVVPQMGFGGPPGAPPGMPFVPAMGAQFGMPFGMAAGGAYDPTQAQMGMGSRHPSGEQVIQDLTPRPEGAREGHPRPQNGGPRRQQYPADAQRGTFAGAHNFDDGSANTRGPRKGENKTLVVEKIPPEHLSLEGVNTWFKRFGTVTNVAIDAKGAKALVSFATPTEAHTAWKSEDAVFGNRFVKVFWHRPMAGHGAAGQKMLAASAPLISNITAQDNPSTEEPSNGSAATPAAAPPAPKKKPVDTAALASKQQLLERQIAEQKTLMARYSSATSAEDKQQIMARLRQLTEEMKSEPAAAPSPTADAEQKKKELLDKELEIVAAGTESEGSSSTTEALKAKLAKLREEAASLGITDPSAPAYPGSPFRGYRGRGRGSARGYYRGRGAVPMRNMKLDNRPRKLVIKGTPGDDDALQAVRGYYDSMGQVESASTLPSGDIVVSFTSRSFAEQAFARPTNVTGIGSVEVAWHSEAPGAAAPSAPLSEPQAGVGEDTLMKEEPASRSPRREDDDDDDMRRMHDDDWDDEDDRRRRR